MQYDNTPRVWLDINLNTLCGNLNKIKDRVEGAKLIAVLKANAYGVGVVQIAETLSNAGIDAFGVAEINEALQLTHLKKPVQILGSIVHDEIPVAVNAGIILPITDLETAKKISVEAVKQNKTVECHFLIDTGMGRLGIQEQDAFEVIKETLKLPNLNCSGIYSHFSTAYQSNNEYTYAQINKFNALLDLLENNAVTFSKIHIANSDAINNFPETYKKPFNYVRTGINLYGAFDYEGEHSLNLEPVLTLKTRLTSVRTLPAGAHIGYGCTYTAPRDMKVGTISAGYADGIPLALSNNGHVLINGRKCLVLGRISMDYTTVSLENVPEAKCGDEVVCLGSDGVNTISIEEWARVKKTHSYDIICSFGSRVERKYISC